jgi:hypothetical protein
MLRPDDLTTRVAELNRRNDTINRYAWQLGAQRARKSAGFGSVLQTAIVRLSRGTEFGAGDRPAITRPVA